MASEPSIERIDQGRAADCVPSALRRSACVAAFTCAHLERVGRDLGFDVVVIAAVRDPGRYAERLSQRRYAGLTLDDVADRIMPSFEDRAAASELDYHVLPFDRRWLGPTSLPSGVSFDEGCLRVGASSGRRGR